MVKVYRGAEEPPVYGPVRLGEMDRDAQLHAMRLTREAIGFAAEIVGFRQTEPLTRLTESLDKRLFEERAKDGLELNDLTKGRTASGRVRAAFNPELRIVIDLAVRALFFLCNVRPLHEHLLSFPFHTGKEMNGLGADHLPGLPRIGHGLFAGIAGSDRMLHAQGLWLATGTAADPESPRFDPAVAKRWAEGLGRELIGPMHDNVRFLLDVEHFAQKAALAAVRRNSPAFRRFGIDAIPFLKYGFPKCLIVDALPFGPPRVHGASSGDTCYPGDDAAMVEAIENAGRHGIARCGLDARFTDMKQVEFELLPQLAERFGETPELVSPQVLEQVVEWNKAKRAGVGPGVRFIPFWHFKKSGYVVRAAQLSGREGGQVHDVTVWRCIGLNGNLRREMVTLLERAAQSWPWGCIIRFREEGEPGMMQPWKSAQREGILTALLAGNAACVSAHRAMEVRRMRALEGQ